MKKTVLRIAGFILLLFIILWKINGIFSFKMGDGNTIIRDFYRLDQNTADVLIIGSSHAYVNFNCGTLWDEYGIAAYDLAASTQPMWNSYHYLKEGLKTQSPELIILEGFGTTYDWTYHAGTAVKNTYGMKWSRNKYQAICASVPYEKRLDFLLDYARYHNRYAELNRGDFFPDTDFIDANGYQHFAHTMGQYLFDTAFPIEISAPLANIASIPLEEKTEEYYRKTIELAQNNNIPIIVVVSPYAMNAYDQGKLQRAAEIAAEYNVEFLNTNLHRNDIGLDYETAYHDGEHMSVSGSRVFSSYLGKYLKEHYTISDRTNDDSRHKWAQCADYVKQYEINGQVKVASNLEELSNLMNNPNYQIFISLSYNSDIVFEKPEIYSLLMESHGIHSITSNALWMIQNNSIVWTPNEESSYFFLRTPLHDISAQSVPLGNGGHTNKIIIDHAEYLNEGHDLLIVIYDTLTDQLVDTIRINLDEDNTFAY